MGRFTLRARVFFESWEEKNFLSYSCLAFSKILDEPARLTGF